jgi:hypothetical protein
MTKFLSSVLRCSPFLFMCWNFLFAQSTTITLPTKDESSELNVRDSSGTSVFKVSGGGLVGIGNQSPVEKLQIGDRWTFHDGGYKIIGYNFRYDPSLNPSDRRIFDGIASSRIAFTPEGKIRFQIAPAEPTSGITSWLEGLVVNSNGYVGIGTEFARANLQIGDLWTFHDGVEKSIAYNFQYIPGYNPPERKIIGAKPTSRMIFTPDGDIKFQGAMSSGIGIVGWIEGLTVKYQFYQEPFGVKVGISTSNPAVELQVGESGDGSAAIANAWNTFSDERFKKNIHPLADALEKTQRLKGVTYQWMNNGETSIGFIAQEVERVIPEIVSTDERGYKSLDYGKPTSLLVEAVKELSRQLQQQQRTIKSLEREIEELQMNSTFSAITKTRSER